MNHPLDSARLKVIRAQEHLDSLKAEVGMYIKEHPYEFILNEEGHPDGSGGVIRIHIAPPLRLSTLVGDCVTNLRAALDYIVCELAIRYFDPPFDPLAPERSRRQAVNFPIYVPNEGGYCHGLKRLSHLLKPTLTLNIPTLVCKAIEAAQTHRDCQWGQTQGADTLTWLHHLVNTDKHRSPLLTIGSLGRFRLAWVGSADIESNFFRASAVTSVSHNTTAESVTFTSEAVNVDAHCRRGTALPAAPHTLPA